ncbi:ribonuclease P protein component [Candidatus Saccharibacteria bacterium]|nr:ribonuclease P protein component [Candidatus Saccharibacteria bacterium]
MLSSKYRFHSRGGVKYTYKHGKTLRRPDLSLVFSENSKGKTRFAVVVSKKVLKSAVGRNRIRRRVYEAIRLNFSSFKTPRDYIFVVYNPSVKTIPFSELEKTIRILARESMIQ